MRFFVIWILIISSSLFASSRAFAWRTPDEALSQFLAFELAGGRLGPWDFNKYLAVAKNYDEPGWDSVILVTSYKATPMSCKRGVCASLVTFVLAPTAAISDQQVMSNPGGGTETLEFVAVKGAKGWLLKPNGGYPHILQATYAKLRQLRH